MNNDYKIKITQKSEGCVYVKARNEEEALDKAEEVFDCGNVVFDSEETFEIEDIIKKHDYKFLTAEELAKAIDIAPVDTEIAFTFDQPEEYDDMEISPSGWYGVKLINIFDESADLLAIGYYGGGSTMVFEVGNIMEDNNCNKYEAIVKMIRDYMEIEDYHEESFLCVEINKTNKMYIKEAMNEMKF